MAYRAGGAFIEVAPAFKGWNLKTAAFIRSIKPIEIPTVLKPPSNQHELPAVKVKAELDEGSFQRNVRDKIAAALKALPKAQIGAATTEAEQKLRDLRAQLLELSGKKIGVDISDADAVTEIERLRSELAALGEQSPSIQVKADTLAAATQLEAVHELVNSLDRDNANVQVNTDASRAMLALAAVKSELKSISDKPWTVKIAMAASPLAIPALAAGAGALGGLGAIGAGVLGGAGAFAAVGGIALKQALDAQKKLTQATKDHTTAVQAQQRAQASLAGAVASANQAEVAASRQVADAERAVADARRNGARQVQSAEDALATARRNGARQVQSAEEALATARRNSARVAEQAERDIAAAQEQLVRSQDRVRASLDDLHAAREQAKRDLEDLAQRSKDDALNQESADIALIEAQQRLAAVQADSTSSALDLRKAQLDVAEAENRVSEVRRQSAQDAADLAKAQKAGIEGSDPVQAAKKQLDQARKDQADARQGLADARAAARRERADADRAVNDAQRRLNQTRADSTRAIADAQRQLTQARADSARSIAAAERNASRARADAAESVAAAHRRVAAAQKAVAAADEKVNTTTKARLALLDKLGPAQLAAVKAVGQLKKGFADTVAGPALGAMVKGIQALTAALPGVAAFLKPVSRGLGDVFDMVRKAVGGKGFAELGRTLGRFSSGILKDAATGTMNLARAFGALLRAFMPLAGSMSGGLVKLTRRFADWARSVGKSDGFKGFISYVRENGPKLLAVLGSLVTLLVHVGKALAPFSSVLLTGIMGLFGFLAKLDPGVLLAIGYAVAALFAAFKITKMILGLQKATTAFEMLNVVMAANPIGAVILLIAAFAAGLIYAYKHSETFRKIVNAAFHGVKAVVQAVVDWFKGPFVRFFTETIPATFQSVLTWVKTHWPEILAFLSGPIGLATLFIVKHWDQIRGAFSAAKDWVVGKFARAWDAVKDTLTGPVQAAKGVFVDIFGKGGVIRSLFSDAVDVLGSIWDRLRDLFAKPINWIITHVINKLIDAVNKVSNALGQGDLLKPFDTINLGGGKKDGPPGGKNAQNKNTRIGRALGGVLPGWTPGVDVHHFYSPTAGYLDLSGGEAIMRPEFTRAVGGPAGVARLNRLARRGFAGGGVVWPLPGSHFAGGFPGAPGWSTYAGHDGIDLNTAGQDLGKPFLAAVDGTISYVGWNRGYGDAIFESGPYGTLVYGHSSQPLVRAGQHVNAGQPIGLVGSTGNSSGPHLHFGFPGGTPAQALALLNGAANVSGGTSSSGGDGGLLDKLNPLHIIDGALSGLRNLIEQVPGGAFGLHVAQGVVSKLGGMVRAWAADKAEALLAAPAHLIGNIVGAVTGGGSVQDAVRQAAAGYGWGSGAEWAALAQIISHESSWNPNAANPNSSARGLFQKMTSIHGPVESTVAGQAKWGLGYIKSRYGDPVDAWRFWQAHNWYRDGGVFPSRPGVFDTGGLARQAGMLAKGPQPERVLSPTQTAAFERALDRGFAGATYVRLSREDMDYLASRPVSVKLGTREVAESVQEYRNDRRLHGEPGWN